MQLHEIIKRQPALSHWVKYKLITNKKSHEHWTHTKNELINHSKGSIEVFKTNTLPPSTTARQVGIVPIKNQDPIGEFLTTPIIQVYYEKSENLSDVQTFEPKLIPRNKLTRHVHGQSTRTWTGPFGGGPEAIESLSAMGWRSDGRGTPKAGGSGAEIGPFAVCVVMDRSRRFERTEEAPSKEQDRRLVPRNRRAVSFPRNAVIYHTKRLFITSQSRGASLQSLSSVCIEFRVFKNTKRSQINATPMFQLHGTSVSNDN